jgi:hypothetical protein
MHWQSEWRNHSVLKFLCCDTTVSWQDTHSQSDNGIQTEVDKKNYADIENNKNILFCTGIFWVGQMHYGPPNEIFGWAMAHPKYRVAPPMQLINSLRVRYEYALIHAFRQQ